MLNKTELSIIAKLSDASFGNAEAMHYAGFKAVNRAYCNKEDNGEMARACYDALRVVDRVEFARFVRKYGLNVVIDKSVAVIGGVTNQKNADKHIRGAKEDIAFFKLIDAHVKPRPVPKEDDRTVAEKADDAIKSMVKRYASPSEKLSPVEQEESKAIAALLNQRIQRPGWVGTFQQLHLNESEVKAIVDFIVESRMVESSERKAA
jgi:hypothetical protein